MNFKILKVKIESKKNNNIRKIKITIIIVKLKNNWKIVNNQVSYNANLIFKTFKQYNLAI